MNKNALICVGVLGLVIGAIVLIGGLGALFGRNMDSGITVTFYDANGNPINKGGMWFVNPAGETITKIGGNVWWKASGESLDINSFNIDGVLKLNFLKHRVSQDDEFDEWVEIGSYSWSSGVLESDDGEEFSLSTVLSSYMTDYYKTNGWKLYFAYSLDATINDQEGNPMDASDSGSSNTITITWQEGSFALTSGFSGFM